MGVYFFEMIPQPKPRMTKSDKWKKRPTAERYFAYANELRLRANTQGLKTIPEQIKRLCFIFPVTESWTKKKKKEMLGDYHKQRPDLSNLLKAIEDILCIEDSHICHIHDLSKVWGKKGMIIIEV